MHDITGNQHYLFAKLTKVVPFENNHVPLALKWGVNRAEMVAKILQRHGGAGSGHPAGPANQYLAKSEDIGGQREYDPDKAKFHLKKAGLDGLKVDVSTFDAAFAGAVDAAVLYQSSAAKSGIEIDVVRIRRWLLVQRLAQKPWCVVYWSGRATEDWMFSTAYERGVPWIDTQFDHDRFNALLLEARAELETDERSKLYG